MNAKVEQRERSHETILESAAKLLREKGISGARVADVMKGAGLTVGGFYAHFASKEELIDDALRRTAGEMRERLFARLGEKPAADRAEVVLKRYLSALHRDEATLGCPMPAVVGEVATSAPEHRAVLADQVTAMVTELENHVPAREGLSRRHLALGLVALMYGGLSLARAVKGTALSDEILRACRALGRSVARPDEG
ncbi:MAG TPA: TetR/AcrR family transcriptional regulator [Polyangiaceae bacterium]|jgi:TetR/AcrR family transcriptional repressor of nem operon|nr:TetR/AcrR family transcriptional regulator [Polyangiaceae bacterium]